MFSAMAFLAAARALTKIEDPKVTCPNSQGHRVVKICSRCLPLDAVRFFRPKSLCTLVLRKGASVS